MAFNNDKFLIFEIVNISNGSTARVKNYYPANNLVVLYNYKNSANINMRDIKPGMTITGQSSGFSITIPEFGYSKANNNMFFDNNFNDYAWQKDFANMVVLDAPFITTVVEDYIYDMYPHTILSIPEYPSITYEIIDRQLDEMIIQDS